MDHYSTPAYRKVKSSTMALDCHNKGIDG